MRHLRYRLLEMAGEVGDAVSDNLLIRGDSLDALKSLLATDVKIAGNPVSVQLREAIGG